VLDHLPPFNAEFNPIERGWKLMPRLRIPNADFETLERLVQEVTAQLVEWARPKGAPQGLSCLT
jgi:transposase